MCMREWTDNIEQEHGQPTRVKILNKTASSSSRSHPLSVPSGFGSDFTGPYPIHFEILVGLIL